MIKFKLTIPNILTMIRIILILPATIFAANENYIWAMIIFTTACITDVLDGYIARKFNMISEAGMMIDPLADKLMALFMVYIICLKGILPFFVFILVAIKELSMILGGIIFVRKGIAAPANIVGKIAAFMFNCAIILSFLYEYTAPFNEILMYISLVMLAIAFLQYAYLNVYRRIKDKGELP
ncbi:MAG: CDP-alcohol phosphatidyltransferase family protein [Eubacteriales bacterium]